ncbi:MAG: hypothetical protein Q4C91_11755 [Eubacteriales bacterium]|nr:hypothetical protein [Eubacteriales bacterium]
MSKALRKIGKFYSSMIMGNIGIFIFIGLLSVVFQEQGWFPNKNIYAISQFVYEMILPVCISYLGGERIGGRTGGILAVLMTAGCLTANAKTGILVGMLAAPVGGYTWKYGGEPLKARAGSSAQMLTGNLLAGVWGCVFAIGGYYILSPFLDVISKGLTVGVHGLLEKNMLGVLSILVEPAKVVFLNNIVNHGILVPLGMSQLKETGSSVLFLVESNPGPGLGMLAALYFMHRNKKDEYATAMVAHSIGGLHEVYFPEVLSNLWLIIPLIAAGMSGSLWFQASGCGLKAPVSPGSIITILLMAGKENLFKAAAGILISAGVSFAGSVVVLKAQRLIKLTRADEKTEPEKPEEGQGKTEQEKREERPEEAEPEKPEEKQAAEQQMLEGKLFLEESAMDFTENTEKAETIYRNEEKKMPIQKIGFICDAGVGSSVMGAALFRRKLAQNQLTGIQVEAYAYDQIPEGLDLIVCQKDFLRLLPEMHGDTEVFAVESLMGGTAFEKLIEVIHKRNG